MKLISIVSGCFNEEHNVAELCTQIDAVFQELPGYDYEVILIDNSSTDNTVEVLREIGSRDHRIKVIVNSRNFGVLRSGSHALMQAYGDAVIAMASDLQDPPQLIREFIAKWEEGYKIVLAIKTHSEESRLVYLLRTIYYQTVKKLADIELVAHTTGFGLYDRKVIDVFRQLNDPYPYFRGLISEIGFEIAKIPFTQPTRKRGISKSNFYNLYDVAMLGFTSHSKVPLRLAAMLGFAMSLLSLLAAIGYFIYKLIYWESFPVGQAPIVIGLFLFSSVQLFFIGVVGEYIGAIHTQVLKRPLVVEKERINF
ncbi:MAG: glycosyltransferase family 2 protein [Chthoniobacterales bacterium]|nr:glycosyltransferase family 2 protein [Chthoniobacterales bacterium]